MSRQQEIGLHNAGNKLLIAVREVPDKLVYP